MNNKIKQLYKLAVRYSLFILISALLLFFLTREFETAYDITFNQGEVVFTVSELLNNVNNAHLSLQYFRDYHKSADWKDFNQKIKSALTEVDLILNGWETDGKKIQPVRYNKTRNSLNNAKLHIKNIIEKTRKFKLNYNRELLKQKWNDIHLELSGITSELNNAKRYIYNHFNISRQNFYNYKILSILFSSIMLLSLGFVLVAKDRQKAKDLKKLNSINTQLQEKINELTTTENQLRNESLINKTILETSLNGFLLMDTEQNILDANPAYCELTGYSKEELLQKNVKELDVALSPSETGELIKKIIKNRKAQFETKHKCKNGSVVDLDVSVSLMYLDDKIYVATFVQDITEKNKAIGKLKQEEERYRIILNNIDEIVYQVECTEPRNLFNGKTIFVSPKTERILGIHPGKFYNDPELWYRNIHPDDYEKLKTDTQKIFDSKGSGERNYRIKNPKTNEYRWIEDRITVLLDEQNNFLGFVGVARDITEWVKAKQALEEKELRYRTLFNLAPNGIMLVDKNGTIIDANKVLCEIFGYNRNELIGNNVRIFAHDENKDKVEKNIKKILNGETLRHNLKNRKKDGNEIFIRLNETKITLPNLEEGILSISEDITDVINMQDALKKSEEKYKNLIEISPVGITILKNGKIVYANPALAKTLGFDSPAELTGKSMIDFVHPAYLKFAERRLKSLMNKTQDKVSLAEEKFIKTNGEVIDVLVIGQTTEFEGEDAVQGYIYDITKQKALTTELEKSRSMLKEAQHIARLGNWQWDLQTNELSWSDEIYNIFEIQPTEVKATFEAFKRMVHKDDLSAVQAEIDKSISSKKPFDIIHRIKLRNGKIKFVQARGRTYYTGKDEPVKVIGTLQDITELKNTELALQESEKRLSSIMKAAPIGLGLIKNRKLVYVNDFLSNFLGYEKSEMEGEASKKFYADEGEYHKIGELYKVAKERGVAYGEAKIKHKSGKLFDTIISLCPLEEDEISGNSIFAVLDITERKQIENRLQLEKARYHGLFEHAPISIWEEDFSEGKLYIDKLKRTGITDFNKYFADNPDELTELIKKVKVVDINMETVRMLKAGSKREVLGGLDKVLIPESIDAFKKEIITLAEGGQKLSQESKHKNFAGEIRDIYVSFTIAPGFEDNWGKIFVTVLDITEKKKSEEQIQYQATLLDSAQDAIIASNDKELPVDLNTTISYWNRGAERLYGWKKEEVLGKKIRDVIKSEPLSASVQQMRKELIEKGKWSGEVIQYNRQGEKVIVMLSVNTVYENGKPTGTFGVNHNITELKEAYNKLEESQKQLQALAEYLEKIREEERTYIAREIHDDLGQTLTALKIDLSWLKRNAAQGKYPQVSKINGMINLVDNTIKTVQRISSQLRPGILDDLGLVATLEWATMEFEERTNIACNLNIQPKNFDIAENTSIALFRIYQEILTNISRHANAKNVNINIEKKNNFISLYVRDDGKGIEQNEINSPKSLGLIGIKERVRGLGGTVEIEGIKNKGTTIKIILPLNGTSEK